MPAKRSAQNYVRPTSRLKLNEWKEGGSFDPVVGAMRPEEVSVLGAAPRGGSGCASFCNGVSTCAFVAKSPLKSFPKWNDRDQVNNLIAKELGQMSIQERSDMLDEIHGVESKIIEETEDFLEEKLESMEKSLKLLRNETAYLQACLLSPSYVQDRELRLMMLRAEEFDAKKAAKRLVSFFSFKLDLFGIDKLVKRITQDDLSEEATKILQMGLVQISPIKDRSGRSVIFIERFFDFKDWRSFFGMGYYILMNALNNVSLQKSGLVVVVHDNIGIKLDPRVMQAVRAGSVFCASLPVRLVAYHYLPGECSTSGINAHVYKGLRTRMRVPHAVSFIECVYQLMSYGISFDMLPTDLEGNINNVDQWHEKLEMMLMEEREKAGNSPFVVIPTSRDVLLGRGVPYQNFVGNIFLNDVIRRNKIQYDETFRGLKSAVAKAVFQYICVERGGRFLKYLTDMGWVDVDEKEALRKISQSLSGKIKSRFFSFAQHDDSEIYNDTMNCVDLLVPPT